MHSSNGASLKSHSATQLSFEQFGSDAMAETAASADCDAVQFHHIDWHIGDWLGGTLGMGLECEGAYCRFINRLYQRGKPLPDDDRIMATLMGLSLRVWKRIRATLVESGKILVRGGSLTNSRFEKERLKRAERIKQQAANARARWDAEHRNAEVSAKFEPSLDETSSKLAQKPSKKVNKINVSSDAMAMPPIPIPIPLREESPNGDRSDALSDAPVETPKSITAMEAAKIVVRAWNEMAERCGLARVEKLTTTRGASIVKRIRDAGSLVKFLEVMGRIEKNSFLLGENERGWKADFDFLLQAKSFTKLLEGGYDRGSARRSSYSANGSYVSALL